MKSIIFYPVYSGIILLLPNQIPRWLSGVMFWILPQAKKSWLKPPISRCPGLRFSQAKVKFRPNSPPKAMAFRPSQSRNITSSQSPIPHNRMAYTPSCSEPSSPSPAIDVFRYWCCCPVFGCSVATRPSRVQLKHLFLTHSHDERSLNVRVRLSAPDVPRRSPVS